MPNSRLRPIETPSAPSAIGPYSQAIVTDGWIYASGQIPLYPETGAMMEGGIDDQTDRVMRNLSSVLEAAGGGLETLVKTTIYLTDMATFSNVNRVYAEHLDGHRPARATVEVAALPRGAMVEIDAVARTRA